MVLTAVDDGLLYKWQWIMINIKQNNKIIVHDIYMYVYMIKILKQLLILCRVLKYLLCIPILYTAYYSIILLCIFFTCRSWLILCVFCSLGQDDCKTAIRVSGSTPRRSDGILKHDKRTLVSSLLYNIKTYIE